MTNIKYFYYIEALPGLNFQSLNDARKEYKAILKKGWYLSSETKV